MPSVKDRAMKLIKGAQHDMVSAVVEEKVGSWAMMARYHMSPCEIQDHYDVTKKVLGTGYHGAVHLARSRENPEQQFAVKTFTLDKLNYAQRTSLMSEVQIFLTLDHPHVARLVNVYEGKGTVSLVMEYMAGGELFSRLSVQRRYSEPDASEATRQMLLAVHYLHSHGVVHRDLKLENWLYESEDTAHLKLIDFGFSKFLKPMQRMSSSCGTLPYMAPEVLNQSYTNQADIWSLGVIVFALVSGYMPFSGSKLQIADSILSNSAAINRARWGNVSAQCKDFINLLMHPDPTRRLTAFTALQHSWIVDRQSAQKVSPVPFPTEALHTFCQAPRLRRCFLRSMSWILGDEATAEVRELFFAIDNDKSGTITVKELSAFVARTSPGNAAYVRELYEALDVNSDDEVSFGEFCAAMVGSRVIHPSDDVLRATFRNFDVDGTGYITKENLQKSFGTAMSPSELNSMLQEAAISTDSLSFSEFAGYVIGMPYVVSEDWSPPISSMSVQMKFSTRSRNSVSKVPTASEGQAQQCCTLM